MWSRRVSSAGVKRSVDATSSDWDTDFLPWSGCTGG